MPEAQHREFPAFVRLGIKAAQRDAATPSTSKKFTLVGKIQTISFCPPVFQTRSLKPQ